MIGVAVIERDGKYLTGLGSDAYVKVDGRFTTKNKLLMIRNHFEPLRVCHTEWIGYGLIAKIGDEPKQSSIRLFNPKLPGF
jgi:hypothetical protein